MKQLILMCCLWMAATVAMAQQCANQHKIFKVPEGKTPKIVKKLGTAPQFTSLRHLNSSADVYDKMKVMGGQDKRELDQLLQSLGYTGIDDPRFGPTDIKVAELPFGAIGMLGDASNVYEYSMIAVPNQTTVKAWQIEPANDGCGLYVVSQCGNAFYHSNGAEVRTRERIVVQKETQPAKLKLNVYARYREVDCDWCGDCDLPGESNMEVHQVLLSQEEIDEIPNGGNSYPVKNVYIDVDKKTFKRIQYMPEEPTEDNGGWMPDSYAGVN